MKGRALKTKKEDTYFVGDEWYFYEEEDVHGDAHEGEDEVAPRVLESAAGPCV